MFDFHIFHHADSVAQQQYLTAHAECMGYLKSIYQRQTQIMTTLQDLKTQADALNAKVAAEATVEKSLETLLTGIAANLKTVSDQLAAALAANDPAAVQAVADSLAATSTALDANITDMTAAVAANTPVAP